MPSAAETVEEHVLLIEVYTETTTVENYKAVSTKVVIIYPACACSVACDSWDPMNLQPARLLCPWNFPGKNTGVSCCFLLQGIFSTKGLNPMSPTLAGGFYITELPRKPLMTQ